MKSLPAIGIAGIVGADGFFFRSGGAGFFLFLPVPLCAPISPIRAPKLLALPFLTFPFLAFPLLAKLICHDRPICQ